jgi:SAM-dependent methyltransferase
MMISRILSRLGRLATRAASPSVPFPTPPESGVRYNLGCGFDVRAGWTNVDMHDRHGPDLVCDVTWLRPVEDRSVDYILAQDVLEHIHRARCGTTLREWNRILRDDAEIAIRVPDVIALARLMEREDFRTPDGQRLLLQNLFGTQNYEGDFHFNGFTEISLRTDLEGAGFEIVHLDHKDEWLFEVLARKVRHIPPEPFMRIEDDGAFVEAAYRKVLGRKADEEGRDYFTGLIADGVPREAVLDALRAA